MAKYKTTKNIVWDEDRKIKYEYFPNHPTQTSNDDIVEATFENGVSITIGYGDTGYRFFRVLCEDSILPK
jgi:hypothetical protein